jgi:hypothetical protein
VSRARWATRCGASSVTPCSMRSARPLRLSCAVDVRQCNCFTGMQLLRQQGSRLSGMRRHAQRGRLSGCRAAAAARHPP